jgi:hypothetical protein
VPGASTARTSTAPARREILDFKTDAVGHLAPGRRAPRGRVATTPADALPARSSTELDRGIARRLLFLEAEELRDPP